MDAALSIWKDVWRLSGSDDAEGGAHGRPPHIPDETLWDELPYKVELWNAERSIVELVLAATSSGSIGFAAYYAATKEFPDRYIVLRHKDAVMARWNSPAH